MFINYIILTLGEFITKFLQIKCSEISHRVMNFGNLYSRLKLTAAATQSEIKSAYFRLCKIYHPDKNTDCSNSAQRFRFINEAYKILSNEQLRADYDKGKHSKLPVIKKHAKINGIILFS